MKPGLLRGNQIRTPPSWVLRAYFGLDPPQHFTLQHLEQQAKSDTAARQFVHVAAKHHLVVRVRPGKYVALDPSVAIRTWALPPYWAELLSLHNALSIHKIDHAFACLAAGALSDYVPDRPWLVTLHDPADTKADTIEKIDRFHFNYKDPKTETFEVLGAKFAVKITNPHETALLLAATGLPRERIAAKQIIDRRLPTKAFARKLNHVGLSALNDVTESEETDVRFPGFIEERRREFGSELLRGGAA